MPKSAKRPNRYPQLPWVFVLMRRDPNEHWGKPLKVFENEAEAEAEAARLNLLSAKENGQAESADQQEYFSTTARFHRAKNGRK